MYGLFHVPFGITGFFIVSHLIAHRNVKLFLFLLLLLPIGVVASQRFPTAHAQPVPVFANVVDYKPFTYWVAGDTPTNITYATAVIGEFYVFEWSFFWPYHPVSFPSTCGGTVPTNDYELLYVYVSVATQQVTGLAYRWHCQWTFISPIDQGGLKLIALSGVYSPNATRPIITFLTHYHVPNNGYPSDPVRPWATSGWVDFQGSFAYTNVDNYNFTYVSQLNPSSNPIDPSFFRGNNWPNVEILTAVGFVVTGAFAVAFGLERKKLAGPVTSK
jgi:hypothetical protein